MSFLTLWAGALPALAGLALGGWGIATLRRNVGLVDILWSLFFLAAVASFLLAAAEITTRGVAIALLVTAWALRLAAHLAARNWNAPEDRRYVEIRARNEPGFAWKSLYLVFGFQALLAWILSAPLAAAVDSSQPTGALDALGVALAATGVALESIADAQLARFKRVAANAGRVMDHGLWRYSRHPNYFGEACTWWGFGLIAAGAGAWWALYAPALMTWLLLRVTGVTLLERGMASRRADYRDYVARTNAFFPGPPKTR